METQPKHEEIERSEIICNEFRKQGSGKTLEVFVAPQNVSLNEEIARRINALYEKDLVIGLYVEYFVPTVLTY